LLEGNQLQVRWENHLSRTRSLPVGLPQGSVISPVLFNVFIDDVVDSLPVDDRGKILLYADDILLFDYRTDLLQELVDCVQRHAVTNDYQLNPKKCLHLARGIESISVAGVDLQKVKVLKYLGFYFNGKGFDARKTISFVRSCVSFRAAALKVGIKKVFGRKCRPKKVLNLYKSFVRPFFDYYLVALGSYSSFVMRMESLQRKVLRHIFGLPYRTPSAVICGLLPLESLEDRAKYLSSRFMKRIENVELLGLHRAVSTRRGTKVAKYLDSACVELRCFARGEFIPHARSKPSVELFCGATGYVFEEFEYMKVWRPVVEHFLLKRDVENECGFLRPDTEAINNFVRFCSEEINGVKTF
jgi:hypothetical protein